MEHPKVPTLKNIATVQVALLLCNDPEVQAFSERVDFCKEWKELIHSKVSKTLIPTDLHKAVSIIASLISFQIGDISLYFDMIHSKTSSAFGIQCQSLKGLTPNFYRWTPEGCIDIKKTVRAIVQDHRVDMAIRFSLAWNYDMGNEALLLLNKMSGAMKEVATEVMFNASLHPELTFVKCSS